MGKYPYYYFLNLSLFFFLLVNPLPTSDHRGRRPRKPALRTFDHLLPFSKRRLSLQDVPSPPLPPPPPPQLEHRVAPKRGSRHEPKDFPSTSLKIAKCNHATPLLTIRWTEQRELSGGTEMFYLDEGWCWWGGAGGVSHRGKRLSTLTKL